MFHRRFEKSCGGLVLKKNPKKILMVRVKNLKGEVVWTFPKGHVEAGERNEETALREVWEETGWECRIAGLRQRPFYTARYFFMRRAERIKKQVVWFMMTPILKTGTSDPKEILEVKWVSPDKARKLARYPSDKMLLDKLKKRKYLVSYSK